ncbi:hypothetical protein [Jiangella aurantiaca]|uniref:hypothetical protein n=1 Tax=Jiangella aurantiaca TaxID=2530373 RepID=UPI0013A5F173|nr:hypothetical protein [Jiangella aurantiaca]
MRTSLYTFPSDLVDEGVDHVVETMTKLGVDELTVALAYHRARDFCPRRRDGRLVYRDDGVFLDPDPELWAASRLVPPLQPELERAAVKALLSSGVPVSGWTVFLHNSTLGTAHPEVTMQTAFGDRLRSNLCPAHPDVASYAAALASTVTGAGVPVVAEALGFLPFTHGDHHERYFADLPAAERILLGICFCDRCRRGMGSAGADPDRLATAVRTHVDAVVAHERPGSPTRLDALCDVVGADLERAVAARIAIVTDLVHHVRSAVQRGGGSLIFLDLTGAALGYDDGRPEGPAAAAQAWQLGIDPAALAGAVDGYAVLAYVRDPLRFEADVRSYARTLGAHVPLRVVLRPGPPDSPDAADLTAKLQAAAACGADAVDFYNYGMAPAAVLARIGQALSTPVRPAP